MGRAVTPRKEEALLASGRRQVWAGLLPNPFLFFLGTKLIPASTRSMAALTRTLTQKGKGSDRLKVKLGVHKPWEEGCTFWLCVCHLATPGIRVGVCLGSQSPFPAPSVVLSHPLLQLQLMVIPQLCKGGERVLGGQQESAAGGPARGVLLTPDFRAVLVACRSLYSCVIIVSFLQLLLWNHAASKKHDIFVIANFVIRAAEFQ